MESIYDEDKAIEAINNALVKNGRPAYCADELLNVVDMIWDYYEENGLLEIEDEDDTEEDIVDELTDYITRMLSKDKLSSIDKADVRMIVEAELAYEDSLLDF